MYLLPTLRTELLAYLPKNGRVVEIGVAQGNFSHEIITRNEPNELHLIDPWEHQERDDYQTDVNNVASNEQEARFQYVSKRFKSFINTGRIKIHRDYSTNVADQFEDNSLDWIFIDGLHSYEGVKSDLEAYCDKVKDDGFIIGHDYTNHQDAQKMQFGVIEAVNEFVEKTNYQFLMMTWENYPSYILCKDLNHPRTQHLVGAGLLTCKSAVSLPDYPSKMSFKHNAININNNTILIPTFSVKE